MDAYGLWERGKRVVKKHAKWFVEHIKVDRLDSTAAHGAYFIMISVVPFLSLLFMIFHRINISGEGVILEALNIFPESVTNYVNGLLESTMPSSGAISVSILAFLWSASSGMAAIMKGFQQIYQVKESRFLVFRRLIAVGYMLVFTLMMILTVVAQVFGEPIVQYLSGVLPNWLLVVISWFRSGFGFILLTVVFSLMFHIIPRGRVKLKNNVVGAAFSAAGWIVFSFFFSIFVDNFSNYSAIYGSLAALIVLMFWLFSCMYIMFLGAEIAMWLEYGEIKKDLRAWWKKKRAAGWTNRGKGKEPLTQVQQKEEEAPIEK